MRIVELRIHAFGPFTEQNIGTAAHPDGLHVIYGPNEAGKSSSLRALRGLLYGIPHNSSDDFVHDSTKLLIGGHLQLSNGAELSFLRRKGQKNTILDLNRRPIDDISIREFLAGVGEELFSTVFCIDHETLVRGGQDILRGGGDIGQSLFAAGLGSTRLHNILADLDSEASLLFAARGQSKEINKAIAEFNQAKKQMLDSSLSSREWIEHEGSLGAVEEKLRTVIDELKRLASEKNRLGRLQAAVPKVALRKELISKLESMGEVVVLSQEFSTQRREYLPKLTAAKEEEKRLCRDLEQLQPELDALTVPQELIDHSDTMLDLHQRLGSHRTAAFDLNKLEANEQQLIEDASALAAELWPNKSREQALQSRPSVAARARISELGALQQALQAHIERARGDTRKLTKELADANSELGALGLPRDPSEPRRAVANAQKYGSIEEMARQASAELALAEEKAQIELQRLGLWQGTLEEVERLHTPSYETIQSFEAQFDQMHAEIKNLKDHIQEEQRNLTEHNRNLEDMLLAGGVPSEEELTTARERRDQGWRLVRLEWLDKANVEEEKKVYDPVNALPGAYEESVRLADDKADHLRREANRVAKKASLELFMVRATGNLENLEKSGLSLGEKESQLQRAWATQWPWLSADILSPREMRSWRVQHEDLLKSCAWIRDHRQELRQLEERIQICRGELMRCLEQLGDTNDSFDSLETLLEYSQQLIVSIDDSNRRREDCLARIDKLTSDLREAELARSESESNLRQWQEEWVEAVGCLDLSKEASPAQANAVLAKLDELHGKVREAKDLEARINGIKKDAEEFKVEVGIMVSLVASDLVGVSMEEAVTELNARLNKAQIDMARLSELKRRVEEKQTNLQTARDTVEDMTERLNSMCLQSRCSKYEELEAHEERSAEYVRLQHDLGEIDKQLAELTGGTTVEDLIVDAQGVVADTLPALILGISAEMESLESRHSQLLLTIGREKTLLEQMNGSDRAAEAAQRAQSLLVEMKVHWDRFVRLRLASTILRREIERYRKENQERLLSRSSEFFSKMTLGSFSSLQTAVNEKDEPILIGMRRSGEFVRVEAMSRGTRDQLYLALRLASIERYVDTNEPFPFVVDDILINFDDNRSKATLEILADLSDRTQILFFTHHLKLVELAESIAHNGVLKVHTLGTS